jgi:tetratricopeptide (TPR) repeat protein
MGPKAKNIKKTRASPQQVREPQVPNPFSSVSLGDDFDMSSIDGVSSGSFDRQESVWGTYSTKDAASLNSASSFESMKSQYQVSKEEKEKKEREEQISFLRDEAKKEYSDQNYKESIYSYTEAIKIFTFNFAKRPLPVKNPQQSESLASLYGNRAAALMMVGAFEAAIDDCNYAIDLVRDYNPLTVSNADREELISMLKVDAGLTLMTKLLARMGRALLKVGRCDEADSVFDRTIRVANSAIGCQDKCRASAIQRGINIPSRLQQQSQKVLNQCLTDATLNKADIKRLKGHLDFIKLKGVRENVDTANSREHNQKMMHRVNAVLDLCPAFHDVQIMKVQCLASMKRWSDVTSYCEFLGCQSVAHDGVFIEDLLNKNPYPNAPVAVLLKSDSIPEDSKEHLQAKYVAEVVLRLPQKMLPLYVRSLRLEERYAEAGKAVFSLSTHLDVIGSNFSHRRQTTKWISVETDKIQRTMEEKEKADSRYRQGEYFSATQMYAQVMLIDIKLSNGPWDMDTAGGRLHAVLHCNRAACFMAMKEFDKAAKECTAALRIEQQYMKAMLRRARCYARLGRLEESTSEYERWMKLVREAKTNPDHFNEAECAFDRAADTSAGDFEKASAELKEVRQMKEIAEEKARQKTQTRARKAQEKAQAEAKRASQNARRRSQSAFNRRQNWYDQQGSAGPRRWDSFNGSSPKKDSSSSRRSSSSGRYNERSSDNGFRKRSNSTASSPSSTNSVTCHYAILNIASSASSSDIKRAYHKMALKYHPDKNPSEQAAEIFRKVQNSYETLSDAGLRRTYDMKRVGTYF